MGLPKSTHEQMYMYAILEELKSINKNLCLLLKENGVEEEKEIQFTRQELLKRAKRLKEKPTGWHHFPNERLYELIKSGD